jgi:hypothetical protein
MSCTEVLNRWAADGTALSCIAEVGPGPALIRMPSCRLHAGLVSTPGSAVQFEAWEEGVVETDWRGTRVLLTYPHGKVVIADY